MTKSLKVCSNNMKSSLSELPDDLLVKILSFFSTKHVVATSLLSKRWKSLWTRVPRLEYYGKDHKNHPRFERFIEKSMFLHQPHFIESLYFKVTIIHWNKDIGPWIRTALHHHHCHLRELEIDVCIVHTILPRELFTCKTLVVLKLKGKVIDVEAPLTTICLPSLKTLHIVRLSLFDFGSLQLLLSSCNFLTDLMVIRESRFYFCEYDVSWCKALVALKLEGLKDVISIFSSSSAVCLPFLKTLRLCCMKSFSNDSFSRLLSNCPVLSDLTLDEKLGDVMLTLDISMPFLQRLSIITKVEGSTHLCSLMNNHIGKLAIILPFFKYFNILEPYMAFTRFNVWFRLGDPSKLEYASIFDRIVHLELSICDETSGEMLMDLLLRSTKLVVLKLKSVYNLASLDGSASVVPECLLSSLEVLEWRGYTGRYGDQNLVSYLLKHALCLKTAKIFFKLYPSDVQEKQEILEDLASMPRGWKSCELVLK